MATTLDERRQKPTPRPAAAMDLGTVDGAAPLNLTRPGTMSPDAPKPVPTQPAPQFDRTIAGPMLRQPPAPVPPAPAVDLNQQRMANQTAMYVQGAQAAAAAQPPSPVQQMMDAPMAAPARPAPMPSAVPSSAGINTMNQRAYAEAEARKTAANPTGSIYGMGRSAAAPAAAQEMAQAPRQPLDAQAAADAKMFGRAWDATKDGFQRAGAAIADVATLPVRAAAGAYDTAVIRPMRAAGLDAGYMSPLVNPASNAEGKSMTPFYDQFRARDEMAQTATDYGNEGRRTPMPVASPAANPSGPRGTNEAQAKNPAADQGQVPGSTPPKAQASEPANDFKKVGDNIYRRGNTFTDQAGTQDAAFLNRGPVSAQNMQAADQLAANYNSNQQALARLQANNAAAQPAPAAAPRQFDRAASIKAMTDLTSPEYRALRALRMEAESEAKDNARLGRAGRGNNAAGQAYAALMGELTTGTRQGQVAEMQDGTNRYTADRREEGATQRALMGEEGATRRAGMTNEVQQGELGLKREAQSLTRERDKRLRKAEDDFLNETDPAKREAKARTLQALMGKGDGTPAGKDRYITMGGGQEFDLDAKAVVNRPQQLFDTVTGQRVGAAPAPAALPPKDKLVVGTAYDTPRGRAVWNGTAFTPVQ